MAVAHVQTVKTVDNASTSPATTGNITTSAGGLVILTLLEFDAVGSTLPAATSAKLDNTTLGAADNTFEALTSANFHQRVSFFSWPNVSAATHSVTIVYAGNIPTNRLYFLTEVSGALTTAAVDGTGNGSSGVGTAAAVGTVTTTHSDDFIICATTSLAANPATFAASASFTIPTNGTETNSSANLCGGVEYWANPGATSFTPGFTLKTGDWVACAIAYQAAAGGGGFFGSPLMTIQAGRGNL